MHSSRENSRKRKNDSDKRGEYWKFDEASSQMRDTLIQSCAERVIAPAASDGGSCRWGFVKELSDDKEEKDNKEEDDVNDEEGGEMGTTGLVFGNDESEDKSDN